MWFGFPVGWTGSDGREASVLDLVPVETEEEPQVEIGRPIGLIASPNYNIVRKG